MNNTKKINPLAMNYYFSNDAPKLFSSTSISFLPSVGDGVCNANLAEFCGLLFCNQNT